MTARPLRDLGFEDEMAIHDVVIAGCQRELHGRLERRLPPQGETTLLFEKLVKDEPITMRCKDVVRWMELASSIGGSYAGAWRNAKDVVRERVFRGMSEPYDDLMDISDHGLLAASEASALFGLAFLVPGSLDGVDLAELGRRADAAIAAVIAKA